eukprot:gene38820-47942_t
MAGKIEAHLPLGAALVMVAFGAQASVQLSACDAPFETVLRKSDTFDARAVWLNRRLARWPGTDAGGTFKLYHSASGQVSAAIGAKVSGADGALAMGVHTAAIPADAAQRFNYVGSGAVLAVAQADQARLPALLKQQL